MTSGEVEMGMGKDSEWGYRKDSNREFGHALMSIRAAQILPGIFFLKGDKMLIKWTWEEWEVSVIRMPIMKFANNQ